MNSKKLLYATIIMIIAALFATAGCNEQTEKTSLAIKYTPKENITYKISEQSIQAVKWDGDLAKMKKDAFKSGHKKLYVEMVVNQQTEKLAGAQNAVLNITVEQLKCQSIYNDKMLIDFDSTKVDDQGKQLANLIGKSYKIKTSGTAKVVAILDAAQIREAVKGNTINAKTSVDILSNKAIKKRHGTIIMPEITKLLAKGDSWQSVQTYDFGIMGKKSFQKTYTIKNIKNNQAKIQMTASPSSVDEDGTPQANSSLANMFDSIINLSGDCLFDTSTNKLIKATEKLSAKWIVVEPNPDLGNEPSVLTMTAEKEYKIERID